MTRNAYQIHIVTPRNMVDMMVDPHRLPVARAAADWLIQAGKRKLRKKPLCINCDAEFHGQSTWAIVVAAPFAQDGYAIVSSICPDCSQRPDVENLILDDLRTVFPDLEKLPTGAA